MTDCNNPDILDALPDLINGRLSPLDHATLTEHVAGCTACASDAELLREIRRAAPLAPHIDVARIVAALPAPSVQHSLTSKAANDAAGNGARSKLASLALHRRQPIWGIMASVAVIAAAGLSVVMGKSEGEGDAVPARVVAQAPAANPATGIETAAAASDPAASDPASSNGAKVTAGRLPLVTAAGSEAGSRANPAATGGAELTLMSGVHELSDADLELLIGEMDKMEGIPAPEPDPVTLELGNLEGDA